MSEKFWAEPKNDTENPFTEIEDAAEEKFSAMQIETEEDLDKTIANVFSEICGNHGRREFFEHAVPAVKQIYGTNFRKAGLRLLEIIDKGAAQKREKIGEYFKRAVSEKEIEYSQKPKQEIVRDIVEQINSTILEKRKEYGDAYKGIVAAIIYGSFARKNFSLNSDLDVFYVSESRDEGGYLIDPDQYVYYEDDFENSLNSKIRPPIENSHGTYYIDDEDRLKGLAKEEGSLIKGAYIVVSPYPEVKARIESLLEQDKD